MEVLESGAGSRRLDEAVASIPLFQGLDAAERAELIGQARLIIFRQGEMVFREGDASRSLFILLDGRVQLFTRDYEGNRILLGTIEPDGNFGVRGLLSGAPRAAFAIAVEETFIAELPGDAVRGLMERSPGIREVLESYAKRHQQEWDSRRVQAGAVDRRQHPRLIVQRPVAFVLLSAVGVDEAVLERAHRATSVDLSLAGIRLRVDDPALGGMAVGARLSLEIFLDETRGKVKGMAIVRNRTPTDSAGVTLLGVQFQEMPVEATVQLKGFIYGSAP